MADIGLFCLAAVEKLPRRDTLPKGFWPAGMEVAMQKLDIQKPSTRAVLSTEESQPESHNKPKSCTWTPYLHPAKKQGPQIAGCHLEFDSFSCAEEKQGEIKVKMSFLILHWGEDVLVEIISVARGPGDGEAVWLFLGSHSCAELRDALGSCLF